MKHVILSRKGFDSQYGGYPSPILPDGTMVSLPIPADDLTAFGELRYGKKKQKVWELMQQAGMGRLGSEKTCHVDPDVDRFTLPRRRGWRPLFGQTGAAASHLDNQGVGVGDLFLFFGFFRHLEEDRSFVKGPKQDLHVIYSWFQVGRIYKNGEIDEIPTWARYHPHVQEKYRQNPRNKIYVAAKALSFAPHLPGGGVFQFSQRLQLTRPGCSRSVWQLPDGFRKTEISYHSEKSWRGDAFQSAAKGQEFVVKLTPAVRRWVRSLFPKA